MESFYLVWNPQRSIPKYQHETLTSAKNEAERLARLHPGERFIVLESVGEYKAPSPDVTWTVHYCNEYPF